MHSIVDLYIIVWFSIVILLGCKTMFDQSRLVQQWREYQPRAPRSASDADFRADPLELKSRFSQIRITFSKHPNNPKLARQAKKVRLDLLAAYAIMIAGFLVFGYFAFQK